MLAAAVLAAAVPAAVPAATATAARQKNTNTLLWAPGMSRYRGVSRGSKEENKNTWFVTLCWKDGKGTPRRESSHYLSRTRAEDFLRDRCARNGVDADAKLRVGWPGAAVARAMEAATGLDWDSGFEVGSPGALRAAAAAAAAPK